MSDKPDQVFPVKLGDKTINLSLKDVIYDAPKGDFPHPNTMTCKLLAGDKPVSSRSTTRWAAASSSGRATRRRRRTRRSIPFATMKELRQHAENNKLTIAQVIMANEMSISGKSEAEVNAFLDKIINAMVATVKSGLSIKDDVLPGPIKLHSKAATVYKRAMDDKYESDRGIGAAVGLRAGGIRGERARPSRHHGADRRFRRRDAGAGLWAGRGQAQGAAGEDPRRHARRAGDRLSLQAQRDAVGGRRRLPGGDRRRLGDGRGIDRAGASDAPPQVVENAAESALEHHLGMTCDPVAGYVQVPCIERCAFGAVKAWTAYMIASNEIASRHRVDFDTTIKTLAETAKDMNSKYKETSEAGLAANLVLC